MTGAQTRSVSQPELGKTNVRTSVGKEVTLKVDTIALELTTRCRIRGKRRMRIATGLTDGRIGHGGGIDEEPPIAVIRLRTTRTLEAQMHRVMHARITTVENV